jgi:hypothetical protein
MSTVTDDPRAVSAHCNRDSIVVGFEDGRSLQVPITWFPRLVDAPAKKLKRVEINGGGRLLHWPDIDEDIDVARLLMPRCARCLNREWYREGIAAGRRAALRGRAL